MVGIGDVEVMGIAVGRRENGERGWGVEGGGGRRADRVGIGDGT